MLQIGGTQIFLLLAYYVRSLFEWFVRNDATTEQDTYPNEAADTGPPIRINMQSLRQTQDQSHATSPEIARETQPDVAAESRDSEAGPSAPSQNEAEADAASTPVGVQSSPSRNRAQTEDTQTGLQVALWATEISASGVLAILAGFIGNQIRSSTHKLFFKASMISLCASFAAGSCILALKNFRPNIQCLTVVVKILIIAAIGSMSLAVGFGVTYSFRKA